MAGKKDLAAAIAARTGTTKRASTAFLDAFREEVRQRVLAGESVTLLGLGTFDTTFMAGRNYYDVRAGEQSFFAGRTIPRFRFAPEIKARLKDAS